MHKPTGLLAAAALLLVAGPAAAQNRAPLPIDFRNSAEFDWLNKKVLDSRVLDDMTTSSWTFTGQGKLSFHDDTTVVHGRVMRVDVDMFTDTPAPTRSHLATINLRRDFGGEDWTAYNRISFWVRPLVSGFPMLPIEIALHNDGAIKVPDIYHREGVHYVTLQNNKWQHVVWEITPLARDRITTLNIGYWVNKMFADPTDRVAIELADVELQRVDPDNFAGWNVAPGRISFSHPGYRIGTEKTAIASDITAKTFDVVRLSGNAQPEIVARKPITTEQTHLGPFQLLDFSDVNVPGDYILKAGDAVTRPFSIGENVWRWPTIAALNFFYGERCGYAIPGEHGVCHVDWTATHGDESIVMNGGWHDAGDLSQGLVNTGEATYAMFSLAERLQQSGDDPKLLATLLDEAKWGLQWCLKVRFPGGYRIGFASMNIWTDGIIGDADDRKREAQANPNVNYIAAAAEAIASRVLKNTDPELAQRSLRIAEDDWRYAITEKETAQNRSTPAFTATDMELAGIGVLASLELYQATGDQKYADKAFELAPVIVASQQKTYVGKQFPLAGFFYTAPDHATIFHQMHRGNDQAPLVALVKLCELFPQHADWMKWYSTVALYNEYQKKSSAITQPYAVLPAYVYNDQEYLQVPDSGGLYQASRASFRDQVLQGTPMGDGYYLRAFPVWFARRGNYGVLLSQAKALSSGSLLRRDRAGIELAQKQAEWIVGRNPFVQSTMYGVGYDWAQQYSVSSGDIVGALPVGMQSLGISDQPYWPSQNTYVYKEVWVHSTSR